ncbi:uncharacterized protein RAG0_03147 [Rhynchosporium agropyri]|uniref:Transcription factor domain-containing protein n=1 Tax=Rhynchosporium agropyri TaxID=914238 RepID=A0A1E1K398_9HELO|nr:uncharacterized protein RAG0_03147 [Rhynchosporium agropyri]
MDGQSNQGRREETYGIYERLQYVGCIQDSQQTSQPQMKPDPQDLQARPSVPDIPLYGQIQTSQGAYLDYTSPKYGHRHQGSRGITHDPIGPPGAHGNWEGNSYARRISPAQFLSGTSVGAQTKFESEHRNFQFPQTSGSTPARRHGSHGDRSKKSQRIGIEVEDDGKERVLPSSELPTPNPYRTAALSILSWRPLRYMIGDVVHDNETAGTVSRLMNLYIKNIHPAYPIPSLAQLEMLSQDFLRSDVANAMPELKAFEPVGHKRKRSASAASQLSIERALFLLILALAGKFDAASPSAQSVQKPCLGACLEENTFSEPGLKYFAAATDIMARHTSGTSLCHVQAFLLKGMYHGQWARDSKCATSLLEAANALQIFLLHKSPQFGISGWDNAICIAFWTQRLLESESVTGPECSESNMHVWESRVPMPDVHRAEIGHANNEHLYTFVAQLKLRKHLDTTYTEVYQQGFRKITTADLDFALSNLQSTITKLDHRTWGLYKEYQPDEVHSKSPWAIRLKAKFVAAMAFAARHFLMVILNQEDQAFNASAEVSFFVKRCIILMEKSAIASSSIKNDRHLTHGQCDDIIILLVAFFNATMKHLINSKLLRDLVSQALVSLKRWPPSVLEQKYVKSLEAMAYQAGLLDQATKLTERRGSCLPPPVSETRRFRPHFNDGQHGQQARSEISVQKQNQEN